MNRTNEEKIIPVNYFSLNTGETQICCGGELPEGVDEDEIRGLIEYAMQNDIEFCYISPEGMPERLISMKICEDEYFATIGLELEDGIAPILVTFGYLTNPGSVIFEQLKAVSDCSEEELSKILNNFPSGPAVVDFRTEWYGLEEEKIRKEWRENGKLSGCTSYFTKFLGCSILLGGLIPEREEQFGEEMGRD